MLSLEYFGIGAMVLCKRCKSCAMCKERSVLVVGRAKTKSHEGSRSIFVSRRSSGSVKMYETK
jgi:hypothetical protein